MKYTDLFITDKNKIENIISVAYIVIDSYVIVSINEMILNEYILPRLDVKKEVPKKIKKTVSKKNHHCCVPLLYNWVSGSNHSIRNVELDITKPENDSQKLIENVLLFLQGLEIEELIMLAKYHNIYYKNLIFHRVLDNKSTALKQQKYILNWIYDNICVYIYSNQYML